MWRIEAGRSDDWRDQARMDFPFAAGPRSCAPRLANARNDRARQGNCDAAPRHQQGTHRGSRALLCPELLFKLTAKLLEDNPVVDPCVDRDALGLEIEVFRRLAGGEEACSAVDAEPDVSTRAQQREQRKERRVQPRPVRLWLQREVAEGCGDRVGQDLDAKARRLAFLRWSQAGISAVECMSPAGSRLAADYDLRAVDLGGDRGSRAEQRALPWGLRVAFEGLLQGTGLTAVRRRLSDIGR